MAFQRDAVADAARRGIYWIGGGSEKGDGARSTMFEWAIANCDPRTKTSKTLTIYRWEDGHRLFEPCPQSCTSARICESSVCVSATNRHRSYPRALSGVAPRQNVVFLAHTLFGPFDRDPMIAGESYPPVLVVGAGSGPPC